MYINRKQWKNGFAVFSYWSDEDGMLLTEKRATHVTVIYEAANAALQSPANISRSYLIIPR